MTLAELRAMVKKNHERMVAINALGKDEKRVLTADESDEFDKLDEENEDLEKSIKREEKFLAKQRDLAKETSEPLLPGLGGRGFGDGGDDKKEQERTYELAFVSVLRGKPTSEQMELLNSRALNTGTDTEGGFLVPETWTKEILEGLEEVSDIRNDITIRKTKSTNNMPTDNDEIEFEWIDELAEYPEVDLAFGDKKLGAHKMGGIMIISRELLNDAIADVKSHVTNKMRRGIAKTEGKAFIRGNGVKKPRGILLDAPIGKTTAVAGAVTVSEVRNMKYSVSAPYRKDAIWRGSDAIAQVLEGMTDSTGKPLWGEGNLEKGIPSTFMGHKFKVDNELDNSLATGSEPLIFGNHAFYLAGDRGEIYIQIFKEKYAHKGAIGILMDKRSDGLLTQTKAIKKMLMGG